MSAPSPEAPASVPPPAREPRLVMELFGKELAPWMLVAELSFAGIGGATLFEVGLKSDAAIAGSIAALGAFATGLGALALLLRRG